MRTTMKTKTILLNTALVFSAQAIPMTVQADVLAIGPNAKVLQHASAPKPGTSMSMVASTFGPAKYVKESKGKVTKRNPKITRWDYDKFSIYFENRHVIHSVVHK